MLDIYIYISMLDIYIYASYIYIYMLDIYIYIYQALKKCPGGTNLSISENLF